MIHLHSFSTHRCGCHHDFGLNIRNYLESTAGHISIQSLGSKHLNTLHGCGCCYGWSGMLKNNDASNWRPFLVKTYTHSKMPAGCMLTQAKPPVQTSHLGWTSVKVRNVIPTMRKSNHFWTQNGSLLFAK
jgi:hypothetical protein